MTPGSLLDLLEAPFTVLSTWGALPASLPTATAALQRAEEFRADLVGATWTAAAVVSSPIEALALAYLGRHERLLVIDDEPTLGFLRRFIGCRGLPFVAVTPAELAVVLPLLRPVDLLVCPEGRQVALPLADRHRVLPGKPGRRARASDWRLDPRRCPDLLSERAEHEWRVLGEGGDFVVFACDDDVVRMARHPALLAALERERSRQVWLAPRLPCPIPRISQIHAADSALLACSSLLRGHAAEFSDCGPTLAACLGDFLGALHRASFAEAPVSAALEHRTDTSLRRAWLRLRARLDRLEITTRSRLSSHELLPGMPDTLAAAVDRFLTVAPADRPTAVRVIHGDLADNLLLDDLGRLSGVLDWTDAGLGDPARDLGSAAALGGAAFLDCVLRTYDRRLEDEEYARVVAYWRGELLDLVVARVARGEALAPWLPRLQEAFVDA